MLGGWFRRKTPLSLRTVRWSNKMSEVILNLFTPERFHEAGRSHSVTKNSVCPEDAFHYLLQSEAKRSKRSGQGYHILLVYRSEAQGSITPMHSYVSAIVLDALVAS